MEVGKLSIKNAMLAEYNEILLTANTGGWHMARNTFAAVMSKIEEGKVTWTDVNSLFQIRFSAEKMYMLANSRAPPSDKPTKNRPITLKIASTHRGDKETKNRKLSLSSANFRAGITMAFTAHMKRITTTLMLRLPTSTSVTLAIDLAKMTSGTNSGNVPLK